MKPKIPVEANNLCWFVPATVPASALPAALRRRGSPRLDGGLYQ